jgi:hypothetical protein
MKINKRLLIISMVLISLFAIGAVNAADSDNITDIVEMPVADEVEAIDDNSNQNMENLLSENENNNDDFEMTVIVEDASYDENVSVEVSAVNKTASTDFSENTVEIHVDGQYLTNISLNSSTGKGSYVIPFSTYDVGKHYVEAILLDGAKNKIMSNVTVFNITQATPIISVQNITAVIGSGVTVPINITDRNGKPVDGDAIVTIYLQGNSISKHTQVINGTGEATMDMSGMMGMMSGDMDWGSMFGGNGTGQTEFNMSDLKNMMNNSGGMGPFMKANTDVKFTYFLPVGNYNITITFLSSRNYKETENKTNLTVIYNTDVVYAAFITPPEKVGDKTYVTIIALDKFGNLMPNINVTAILDDGKEAKTSLNENATGMVTFDDVLAGSHKLVLSSNATGNVTNQTFDFTVVIPKVNIALSANGITTTAVNVDVDGKTGPYLTVSLKDALGNVLVNKNIQISIDSKKYALTTDKDGIAKLQLNIAKANVYTCAIAFLGDDTYNGAFNIVKVTVKKQTAKLTTAKKTYKAKAKTKKLTATFKSSKGKALKGKKITFTVKGKTYKATTNAKGVATVKVKLTKKGKYTFTAKFAGDDTYNAISKKAKLILK